jgi:hypothetical protein
LFVIGIGDIGDENTVVLDVLIIPSSLISLKQSSQLFNLVRAGMLSFV